ncbi:MAG: bi-domain-containing oxidoreductase [Candidatus Liptonbacteria bacterium]|nr:bi-domain-containing oxidoreductase [Candidatus Liptonbacteria bacterium]
MKALYYRNNQVVIEELPAPQIGAGEILVQNAFSAISPGSELFAIAESSLEAKAGKKENLEKLVTNIKERGLADTVKKVLNAVSSQAPLGYSSAGVVLSVGREVRGIQPGDSVACMGMEKAVHGEVVAVPQNLVAKLPAGCADLKAASFGAIGCIAMNSVRKLQPQMGDVVVIHGAGLIGLMTLLLATVSGARCLVIEPNADRRKLAGALGAYAVFAAQDEIFDSQLSALTSGRGADGAIFAAASKEEDALRGPLQAVRPGGAIVVLGKAPIALDYNLAFKKDIRLLMSRSYGPGRYDPTYEEKGLDYPAEFVRWTERRNLSEFLALLAEKKINIDPLISREVNFDQAPSLYAEMKSGAAALIGAVIRYPEAASASTMAATITNPAFKPKTGVIRVGLIGVGDFAKGTLLPILSSLKQYEIRALVARKPLPLPRLARQYGVKYTSTDADQVINDPEIDMVFILTPNNTHADFVRRCLAAKKACFVEKPLCVKLSDQEEIEKLAAAAKTPVFVGYNRRYAPLTLELQKYLRGLPGPTVINYTVNAGFMDPGHWMQDPAVGGGRWISEGCHFMDLGRFLTGSEIASARMETMPVDGQAVRAPDNYLVIMSFKDGSQMVITYTSLGAKPYPKEVVQIFKGGLAAEIRDFKTLTLHSARGSQEKKLAAIDKGHRRQLEEIAKRLRGEPNLVPEFADSARSNRETLQISNSLESYEAPRG